MNELALALSFCTTLSYALAGLAVLGIVLLAVSELKN